MVAGSTHLRLEACPSAQLNVLLVPWNTAGESSKLLPAKSLAGEPYKLITHVPQFSPRGSFSSIHKIFSLACSTWARRVRIELVGTPCHTWPSKPSVPA